MIGLFKKFIAFLWGILFNNILWFFYPSHCIPNACPDRTPPDETNFPNYFQNKEGLWLYWREWRPTAAASTTTTAVAKNTKSKSSNKSASSASSPSSTPCGVVFLVGGLGEHTARYDPHAKRFCEERNFVCFSMDHQGQGCSEGVRKYTERFSNYVDDLEQFVHDRLVANPDLAKLPRFLLCHSMGGLMGTQLLYRHPTLFNGSIISSPALQPDPDVATPFMKAVSRFLANYVPKLPVAALDGSLVSRNRQIVELYLNDPVVSPAPLRARWANETMSTMESVFKHIGSNGKFPFLLLHGSNDKICRLEGSQRFFRESPSADKRLKVYDGVWHEAFTDPEKSEEVWGDVFEFVDSHMKCESPLLWS